MRFGIGRLVAAIGVFLSGLSMTVLVKQGFDLQWSPLILSLLNLYDTQISNLVAPLEPLLLNIIHWVQTWFHLDLDLDPRWKHLFYILWFYFGRDAFIDVGRKRYASSLFTFVWGGLVSLVVAVFIGGQPFGSDRLNLSILLPPVAGFILFDTVRSVWRATFHGKIRAADGVPAQSWLTSFRYYWVAVVWPFVATGVIVLLARLSIEWFEPLKRAPNPSLLLLFVFLVANAGLLVWRAFFLARKNRKPSEKFWARFQRSGSAKLGILMLEAVGVLLFMLSFNAGLKQLGI